MASTSLNNTNQMYCQDRTRQERLQLTILDKERIVVLSKKELVDVNYLKTITKKLENLS